MKLNRLNRRNFLKIGSIAGVSALSSNLLPSCKTAAPEETSALDNIKKQASIVRNQKFNMSGFAAPKLDVVRTGHIGLGRGSGHVSSVSLLEGVEIKALCDLIPEEVERTSKRIATSGFKPDVYTGDPEAWKKMCDRDDIDLDRKSVV